MLKYMKHPDHGFTPVYSFEEIRYNKANGWLEAPEYGVKSIEYVNKKQNVSHETIADKVTYSTSEDSADYETPEAAYEKKFGKPPHHKMKLETIIKKLEE